jgi:hypothetical protein
VFKEETGGGGGFKKRGEGNGAGRWGQVGPASRCWVVGSVASQGPLRPGSPCCFARRAGQKCLLSNFFWPFPFLFFALFFSSVLLRLRHRSVGPITGPLGPEGPAAFEIPRSRTTARTLFSGDSLFGPSDASATAASCEGSL